ncbi:hypothetical protein BT69DRAFT_1355939 [Atractiella rhizophila]|nr:hypothetical protein BT69DRAFT_1355939 [Atractiella rhizophila]
MSLSADTRAGDPPFDFEEKIPSEILHLILSYNFPRVNECSHFASLSQVNKRWSAEISRLLLSWISIPLPARTKGFKSKASRRMVQILPAGCSRCFQIFKLSF